MLRAERRLEITVSVETRYYISSVENDAKLALHAARGHWGIENGLHWVLDIAFREDASRVRKDHGPENLAVLRHIALNLLKQEQTAKMGIKTKRLKAAWDEDYLFKVLSNLDAIALLAELSSERSLEHRDNILFWNFALNVVD